MNLDTHGHGWPQKEGVWPLFHTPSWARSMPRKAAMVSRREWQALSRTR
jgi:hypothetical protein